MSRKNCWEVRNCGRGPGGNLVETHGLCPAATSSKYDGVNGGKLGGRFCWNFAGTFSGNGRCSEAEKFKSCLDCPFFRKVVDEEGRNFIMTKGNADDCPNYGPV